MRWWFCTASSPRSSTSNPKAAVLRRHRPKSGGTGISRFRRFCLIAVAAPSRAGPDTGRRAHRRSATPPLLGPPKTSRTSSATAESRHLGQHSPKDKTIPLFQETFSPDICNLIKNFKYCKPDMREADRRTLPFRRTIRRPAHISDTYDIPAHGTARAPAGISHDGVPPFINQSLYHYETFITRSADPPSQRWRQSPAPTTRKP